jgi:hypothetical protein
VTYPSHDNPRKPPTWGNYVVAQVVQASLGRVARSALAFGAVISDREVCLLYQMTKLADEDREDMQDIVSDLEAHLGPDVDVGVSLEIRDRRMIDPHDGVRCVYLARFDGD